MLFWLLLGFTGVLQGVGFGAIANTAHLVGLLAGLLWLWLLRLPGRRSG
jgi:GlpG protein